MSIEEKKEIAQKVQDFFNTLPKNVVGVQYNLAKKTVNIQFVEKKSVNSLEDLIKEFKDIVEKENQRKAETEKKLQDLFNEEDSVDLNDFLRSMFSR